MRELVYDKYGTNFISLENPTKQKSKVLRKLAKKLGYYVYPLDKGVEKGKDLSWDGAGFVRNRYGREVSFEDFVIMMVEGLNESKTNRLG